MLDNNIMVKQKKFKAKTDLGQVCYELGIKGRELERRLHDKGYEITNTTIANHLNGESIKVHELKWYHNVLQDIDHNISFGKLIGNSVPKYAIQFEETPEFKHLTTMNLIEEKPKAVLMFGHAEQKPNVKAIFSTLLGKDFPHIKFFSTLNNLIFSKGFAVIMDDKRFAHHVFVTDNDNKGTIKVHNFLTNKAEKFKITKLYPSISMNFRQEDFEITDI